MATFTLPVAALDEALAYAAHSVRKRLGVLGVGGQEILNCLQFAQPLYLALHLKPGGGKNGFPGIFPIA